MKFATGFFVSWCMQHANKERRAECRLSQKVHSGAEAPGILQLGAQNSVPTSAKRFSTVSELYRFQDGESGDQNISKILRAVSWVWSPPRQTLDRPTDKRDRRHYQSEIRCGTRLTPQAATVLPLMRRSEGVNLTCNG